MDPNKEPTPPPAFNLCEVFSTPYTDEDVARGVRAKQNIAQGVVVEVAHCIRIPKEEYEHHLRYLDPSGPVQASFEVLECSSLYSVLEHYLYVGRNGDMLLALGVGSLFNHSQQPNLYYTIDHDQLFIKYRATRAIAAHEELTITYGSSSKLWFEDKSVSSNANSSVGMMHEYMDDENAFLGLLQVDS